MPRTTLYVEQPEAPNATLILIFGVLAYMVFPLLGPVAWYMGSQSRKAIDAAPPGTYRNTGLVTAGWILGIVMSVFLLIAILITVVVLTLVIVAAANSDSQAVGIWAHSRSLATGA